MSAEKSGRQADKPFVISREIDAPSDLVCRFWTERVMRAMMNMEKLDIKSLQ